MYPISDEMRALFESEAQKTLKITGLVPVGGDATAGPAEAVSIDDALGGAAKGLSVSLEPVQELNGYTAPWPAGGGKNKIPGYAFASGYARNGITCTYGDDGILHFTGTATANTWFYLSSSSSSSGFSLPVGEYLLSGMTATYAYANMRLQASIYKDGTFQRGAYVLAPGDAAFSISESELFNLFVYFGNGVAVEDVTVEPMIRLATEVDGSYAPYVNACPITGWTGDTVTRVGKNLADATAAVNLTPTAMTMAASAGTVALKSTSDTTRYQGCRLNPVGGLKAGVTYTLSADVEYVSGTAVLAFRGTDNLIRRRSDLITQSGHYSLTYTPTDDGLYLALFCTFSNYETGEITYSNIQLEIGDSATDYAPCSVQQIATDWSATAGTVGAGEHDVIGGSLSATYRLATLGGGTVPANVAVRENTVRCTVTMAVASVSAIDAQDVRTNLLPFVPYTYSNDRVGAYFLVDQPARLVLSFPVSSYGTTAESIKAKLAETPLQVCYKIAEPVSYSVTAADVELVEGVNHLWSDAGDVTLTYGRGDHITLTDDECLTFNIDRYCCNGNKLEIGTAIAAELTVKIDNYDGVYDNVSFEGRELTVGIGVEGLPDVFVPCGIFISEEQPRTRSTITIQALDRMVKFDVAYTDDVSITFPATVANLVGQVANLCSVPFSQDLSGFPNADFIITGMPTLQQVVTLRNLIQWCAGLMGTSAWIDWDGSLRFSWYAGETDYVMDMENRFEGSANEDSLTITGVKYTSVGGTAFVAGSADYALDLTGNYLLSGDVLALLENINNAVNGFSYRPFSANVVAAPYLWPMDLAAYEDASGNSYATALTNVNCKLNGTTALAAVGVTNQQNSGEEPSGLTEEQAYYVNKTAQVVADLDDSLDQQGVFNRLTDNGAAQGVFIENGQVYVNASYLRSGTIDGDSVNAKLLNIVDGSGNVIASFQDVIQIGQDGDAHAVFDFNSFELYDKDGNVFFAVGDTRDSAGLATVQETIQSIDSGPVFTETMKYAVSEVASVYVNGTQRYPTITISGRNITMDFGSAAWFKPTFVITYKTTEAVYHYDFGTRKSGSDIGQRSVAEGGGNEASGDYSHAEGYNTTSSGAYGHAEGDGSIALLGKAAHAEGGGTIARGDYSHVEGQFTVATGDAQHVFGKYNVLDPSSLTIEDLYDPTNIWLSQYAEIVGNGSSDSSRANARTLDWSGNEWIAGTLTQASDARLKDEAGDVPDLSGIRARRFRWNAAGKDNRDHIGYYAQDVEAVAPYLVGEDAMGYKSLDYIGLLCAKIEQLERRVAELEGRKI